MQLPITGKSRAEVLAALASFSAVFYDRPITFYCNYRGRVIDGKPDPADIDAADRAVLAALGTTPEREEAERTIGDYQTGAGAEPPFGLSDPYEIAAFVRAENHGVIGHP